MTCISNKNIIRNLLVAAQTNASPGTGNNIGIYSRGMCIAANVDGLEGCETDCANVHTLMKNKGVAMTETFVCDKNGTTSAKVVKEVRIYTNCSQQMINMI